MENTIKRLKKINRKIKDKTSEINGVDKLAYYVNFPRKKDRDLLQMQIELRALLSVRFSLLETLELEIKKVKMTLSEQERTLSLIINKIQDDQS